MISATRGWQAVGDVDGDGHPDRPRLVYLGGYGADNWELVVDMTRRGQQTVRFTGSVPGLLPGARRWSVAVQHLGPVGVPGRGGPVRV